MPDLRSLLDELKRRKVFRAAGLYTVGAWVLIEAADVLAPALRLPEWSITFVVFLAILGFPVALVLAWAFDVTPTGVERQAPAPQSLRADDDGPAARSTGWLGAGMLATFAVLLGFSGYFFFSQESSSERSDVGLDANTVAVLPFRVAGADRSLDYLREGMLDLLAAKLTGEGGPRAVDPRSLVSAWRRRVPDDATNLPPDRARALARELGAGQAVMGEVVGSPEAMVVTASVLDAAGAEVHGPVNVDGPVDSLPTLIDRLAAGLLSVEAGEDEYRLASLTSRSLPALRAYLQGRAANRRGRYQEGRRHFETALEHDSTFALAGIGLRTSAGWIGGLEDVIDRGLRVAWQSSQRLSPRDRAYLDALVGPRYPLSSSEAEELVAWERALEAAPDRAEVWEMYGDQLFHYGRIFGIPDADRRAGQYLGRAVALDSTLVGSLMHLVQLAAKEGDTARVGRLADAYLARDSTGDGANYVRWRAAEALADSAALERNRARFDSIGVGVLFWIGITGQEEGIAPVDAERAVRVHYRRARTRSERLRASTMLYRMLLNHGRPAEALRVSEELMGLVPDPRTVLGWRVLDGLYAEGDTAAASAAAREIARTAEAPLAEEADERMQQLGGACVLEQWRLWHGQTATAAATIERLRSARSEHDGSSAVPEAAACATLLEALLATLDERADAADRVERLEALLRTVPPMFHPINPAFKLLARLHQMRGDSERALAAIRSRRFWGPMTPYQLATRLGVEGRLAAEVGDTTGAIRAYRHYLALRSDPEPVLREEVARIQDALRGLIRTKEY